MQEQSFLNKSRWECLPVVPFVKELRARRARHILAADRKKNYRSRISDWIYGF